MFRWTVLILTLMLSGCGSAIVRAMVHAPNMGAETSPEPSPRWVIHAAGVDRELFIPVGPPAAVLRVWLVEPPRSFPQPKGTLLVMHGYRVSMAWVEKTGRQLAEAGYRVALIDLRGHGRSTGDYITYGVVESRDASQVIDALQRQGLVAGPLGVWGMSMGAATAIKLAADDPRIEAVVAVAPYTSMRDVVPGVVRLILPPYGWLVGDEAIRRHVDDAGKLAGFDPDDADILAAVKRVTVPTLLLHGTADWIIPVEQGRALHNANPQHTRLIDLSWTGHLRANFSATVRRESIRWFDEKLAASQAQ